LTAKHTNILTHWYDGNVQVPENVHNITGVVDLERWPLVVVRPPSRARGGEPIEADAEGELEEFYQSLEQVFARRRPYVVLYDVRGASISASRRDRMSEWTNRNDSSIRTHMIALAVVVSSEVERAHVTAGFWSLRQSYHARIFESIDEAERWLLSEFARGEGAN
jgi:hypothetical protein